VISASFKLNPEESPRQFLERLLMEIAESLPNAYLAKHVDGFAGVTDQFGPPHAEEAAVSRIELVIRTIEEYDMAQLAEAAAVDHEMKVAARRTLIDEIALVHTRVADLTALLAGAWPGPDVASILNPVWLRLIHEIIEAETWASEQVVPPEPVRLGPMDYRTAWLIEQRAELAAAHARLDAARQRRADEHALLVALRDRLTALN